MLNAMTCSSGLDIHVGFPQSGFKPLTLWSGVTEWSLHGHTYHTNLKYRKFPKYSDAQKICCNHSKIWTMWLYHRVMSPNDADGMANSADTDQTAPRHWSDCSSRSSLIWVCTVCPDLPVRKHRNITVLGQIGLSKQYRPQSECSWRKGLHCFPFLLPLLETSFFCMVKSGYSSFAIFPAF